MSPLDVAILRSTLQGHAARATEILVHEGSAACDAYLASVGYAEQLDTLRAAGGVR